MSTQTHITILAPARDFEVGKAAIDAGADAVYIGAPMYGARQAANNSLEDIQELVGKKVYLELYVKTIKHWRDKERYLNELGFNEKDYIS